MNLKRESRYQPEFIQDRCRRSPGANEMTTLHPADWISGRYHYQNSFVNLEPVMKKIILRAALFLLLTIINRWVASAQSPGERAVSMGTTLDAVLDARAVSMGESFVAVGSNPYAGLYNPAGLAGIEGLHVIYSRLYFTTIPNDLTVHFFAASVHLPFGDFSLLYTRSNNAYFSEQYNHTLALTGARRIGENLSVGVSVKSFDEIFRPPEEPGMSLSTSLPLLVDLGIQYTHAGIMNSENTPDTFTAGASLQNFGTDFRGTEGSGGFKMKGIILLPRYVRAGFAYQLRLRHDGAGQYDPWAFLLTGEYRNLLNATGPTGDIRDYWGFGMESTFSELISLRIGGYVSPLETFSWFSSRGIPAFRYGLGIRVPFARIGISAPLTVKFDYAEVPQVNFLELGRISENHISFELVYDLNR